MMLPRQSIPIAEAGGRTSEPFYRFLQDLEREVRAKGGDTTELQRQIDKLREDIAEGRGDIGLLLGSQSVRVVGQLSNGNAFVSLQGDQDEPGPTYTYGTNAEGEKGWFALADGLLEGEGVALSVDATGRVTFGLAPLPDTGGGTLQKLERDQYGRVSGTSEATTDDLPEGEGNRYFTPERARDAAPIQSLVAGANVSIDATDPANPVISASGGGSGGAVESVNGKTGVVELDAADVGAATAEQGEKADSALQTAVLELVAGTNVSIDAADPERPVINATGGEGADGESAYQVAVDNGFVGTEQEWLDSLVGPRGPRGPEGPPGPSGSGGILPMVNGEVPPVLMHADDGSLIYSQVA